VTKKNKKYVNFLATLLKIPTGCVIFLIGVEFLFKTVTVELDNNR